MQIRLKKTDANLLWNSGKSIEICYYFGFLFHWWRVRLKVHWKVMKMEAQGCDRS